MKKSEWSITRVRHISLFSVVLATLYLVSIEYAYADEEKVGKVVYMQGTVSAINKNKVERDLVDNGYVYNGDLIRTSIGGSIQLRFKDGSVMSLIPGSEFAIEEYSYGEGESKEAGVFSLIKGGLRTLSGLLRKDRYNVKTPVATIGLRGTLFTANILESGKLLVRVGFDPQEPTGVQLTTEAGTVVLSRGESAIVDGSTSLPTMISEATANTLSVTSTDNILNVVSAANILDNGETNKPIPDVVMPGDDAKSLPINTDIDPITNNNCVNSGGGNPTCGTSSKLNAAISRPAGINSMQSGALKNAGITENFDGNSGRFEGLAIYGNDAANNNVAFALRPGRDGPALNNTASSIANRIVGENAFQGTSDFFIEAPGKSRARLIEYQRVTNMNNVNVPLSWARWTQDTILHYSNGAPASPVDLNSQSMHAVFGEALQNSISTLGAGNATYYLVGGTTPTSFNGVNSGALKSGEIRLDFASSRIALDLVVNHPVFASSGQSGNADFNMVGSNIGVDSVGTFSATGLSVISSGCVGCTGGVNGLFSGDSASGPQSAGMVYQITDGVEGISGAAGFERQ